MGRHRSRTTTEVDYQALTPLGGPEAHVRFAGRLQDRPVIWDARLLTLGAVYRHMRETGELRPGQSVTLTQFLEIEPAGDGICKLRVGLDVPCIDEPTVLKTLIMIHNYQRLQPGRHDYGPSRTFPDEN
ncbi:MAG TPA: hypothetical protein EYP40_08705 [Chromatiales bacterium]|nr:hypothetical protein [Chromatiales bacterium]